MYKSLKVVSLLMVITFLVGCGTSEIKTDKSDKKVQNAGSKIEIKEISLDDFDLSIYLGEKVFINFWATWCPPCKAEMPDINKFYNDNKGKFVFLSINIGEDEDKVRKFMSDNNLNFDVLLDKKSSIFSSYKLQYIPTSFFMDEEGKLIKKHEGILDYKMLDELIN